MRMSRATERVPRPPTPAAPSVVLPPLAEREAIGLRAWFEERYLDRPVGDSARLADQLVEPLLVKRPVPLLVDVEPVRVAGRLAVDRDPVPDRRPTGPRPHHEVDVARVEA